MKPAHALPTLQQVLDHGLLWNSMGTWAEALIAFLVPFTVLPILKGLIAARRRKWLEAGHQLPMAMELVARLALRTSRLFIWAVALYCGFEQLDFPAEIHLARRIDHGVSLVITVIFWIQAAHWGMAALRYSIERRRGTAGNGDTGLSGSADIVLFVAGILIWGMAALLALDNLGIAIRPLLAGLGIGGIAVALAVQTVLSDLLASMSIALDKPFVLGDLLTIDALCGTVEHIGVKSTRLRSCNGEQIVMANADILKSRLHNFGRMNQRAITFELPVCHDTAPEALAQIPSLVADVVKSVPSTRFDHCTLMKISETALRFEISYSVLAADYATYATAQNAVLLGILGGLRRLGVQLPTPVQAPMPVPAPATG